jgi:hypothetical protein
MLEYILADIKKGTTLSCNPLFLLEKLGHGQPTTP